jgi:hypothetical protein
MSLFSAAAAAALEHRDDGLQPGLYSHSVELELTVKTNGKFAPSIVVKILAQLVLDEPDVVFVDRSGHRILIEDFPETKADFDEVFSSTIDGGRLSCKFAIQSSNTSFRTIKISVWSILQETQVWLKKAPGPVQKTQLSAIGFWMNVHPGFWSSRVFYTQMMTDIEQQYSAHPEILKTYGLPTKYLNVDMYFSRRKINAEYSLNGKNQRINTDAFMVYAPRDNVDTAMVYLTKISSLGIAKSNLSPMVIPMAAKYSNPVKFGQYAAQHNDFLNNHRNIAIVSLPPIALDTDLPNGRNLWEEDREFETQSAQLRNQ